MARIKFGIRYRLPDLMFQQDGESPHYSFPVGQLLNETFPRLQGDRLAEVILHCP